LLILTPHGQARGKIMAKNVSTKTGDRCKSAATRSIPIKDIIVNPRVQVRAKTSIEMIEDYRVAMLRGDAFPPVEVVEGEYGIILWDGFQRHEAAQKTDKIKELQCHVQPGGMRDAILLAVGANATHGLRRTASDKQIAVTRLLYDSEWGQWSDREIARLCHVSPTFVGELRAGMKKGGSLSTVDSEKRTYKSGTLAKMKTGNIGKKSKKSKDHPKLEKQSPAKEPEQAPAKEPEQAPAKEPKQEPRQESNVDADTNEAAAAQQPTSTSPGGMPDLPAFLDRRAQHTLNLGKGQPKADDAAGGHLRNATLQSPPSSSALADAIRAVAIAYEASSDPVLDLFQGDKTIIAPAAITKFAYQLKHLGGAVAERVSRLKREAARAAKAAAKAEAAS
jgi:hypothetical protein